MTQVQWRIKRQPSGTVDSDFNEVQPLKDSVNRFARNVIGTFDDPDGTKQSTYERGQRVDFEVSTDGGNSWTRRMSGTVLKSTNKEPAGSFEIDVVGYDHFLRREDIHREAFTDTSISSALNTLVTTYSSVSWNPSNVSVSNDVSFTRTFEGIRLDEAIVWLASQSGDEDFGVNNDYEFFFTELDTNRASPILDGDWFDYDLPETGKKEVNRVTVFYGTGGGQNAITVDDRESQKELKNKLGAARNVVLSDTKTYPEVSNRDTAKAIANQLLGEHTTIITGTVTTFGHFDTDPGDVLRLQISEKNIDSDFRVAEIEYDSSRDETRITIAENVGNVEDLLVQLADEVGRLDIRDADTTVTPDRVVDFRSGVSLRVDSSFVTKKEGQGAFLFGKSEFADSLGGNLSVTNTIGVDTSKVTVPLLNIARDTWADGNSAWTDQTHYALGADNTSATRADSSLRNETNRIVLDKFGAGNRSDRFEFVASVPPGGRFATNGTIWEVGPVDKSTAGNVSMRSTASSGIVLDNETRLKAHEVVTIRNATAEQGVITNVGQERLRDLIIGESGHEPATFVYGNGTADAVVSNTSLQNQLHSDAIDSSEAGSTGIAVLVEETTSGEADTDGWSELGQNNTASELVSRVSFEPLESDVVLIAEHGFKASNE